jgi:hypothetical protein
MEMETPNISFDPMGQAEGPLKTLNRNKGWIMHSEGMECNEISLGSVEDGLYFKEKEKGLFFLSKT